MDEFVSPLNTALISGVLQQIHKVNYMIDFCTQHNDDSMIKQFERQREGFLEELTQLLADIGIQADLKAMAIA